MLSHGFQDLNPQNILAFVSAVGHPQGLTGMPDCSPDPHVYTKEQTTAPSSSSCQDSPVIPGGRHESQSVCLLLFLLFPFVEECASGLTSHLRRSSPMQGARRCHSRGKTCKLSSCQEAPGANGV